MSAIIPLLSVENKRLDKTLSVMFYEYSRTMLKKMILNGYVSVNGDIVQQPNFKVLQGDVVTIYIVTDEAEVFAKNILLNIVYEDDDILVINKQKNVVVHPGAGNVDNTILNALLYKNNLFFNIPRAGIIHRLDKNTTGLMLIAKNIFSYNKLKHALKIRSIVREYEAIVIGNIITGGIIEAPILRHFKNRTKMFVNANGRYAKTHYRIIERFQYHTHLRITIETGRTHQIRVHFLHIKHPILGDPVYKNSFNLPKGMSTLGIKTLKSFSRQALHACKLIFMHPKSNQLMTIAIQLPKDMLHLIDVLRQG
ncbi:23S rRNA pseudouridine(1911/1915/1917) synthase RluD [Buchnera aphidicola]|uniref:23S rRNA pseudouridine(1911/1915/1917) synthase RluD n=1 Tax=Buchnera aphidicola TaxID=9 RepID=UPI0031B897E4